MKKLLKSIIVLTVLAISITACAKKDVPPNLPDKVEIPVVMATPDPTSSAAESSASPEPTPTMTPEELEAFLTTPEPTILPDVHLELNKEEQKMHDAFKKSKDLSTFKGATVQSLAKINIQYSVEGDWESEYAMFYQDEEMLAKKEMLTKEEYGELNAADLQEAELASRKELADFTFPYLDDAKFVVDDDTKAHLEFVGLDDFTYYFAFVKNKAGEWQVRFNPVY